MHLSLSRALTALAGLAAISGAACGRSTAPNLAADVWAVVDDREIRQADVEKAYRRVAPPQPVTSTDEELGGKLSLLDEMITQRVLLKRAAELKIEVTDAEVETAYGERKRNLPDDQFLQQLKDRNLTVEDMKAALRDELTADRVIEREVTAKIAVTDAEVADFYNKNKAQFNVAEPQFRLAQIVVTPVRDPQLRNLKGDDATTPEAAKAKAQMLMGQLKAGTQFSQLARDYSEDPQSAPNGGDLGFISASQLAQVPQQLREVVLRTDPGNASLVTAGNAYTLVLVIAKEPAGQRELSNPNVRDTISTNLRERREQVLRAAFLTSLRNDARIVNNLAKQTVAERLQATLAPPPSSGK